MFAGLEWYDSLKRPTDPGVASAWYCTSDPDAEWEVCLLKVALLYARHRGLWDVYRERFSGIRTAEISIERARACGRLPSAPVWQIATELMVAAILEHAFGWRYVTHEPLSRDGKRGDWLFITPQGQTAFVEVKTLDEPVMALGESIRRSCAPRIRNLLARAYKQLPDTLVATLVVIVGNDAMRVDSGLLLGNLAAAMFGEYQLELTVMTPSPRITYAGPSFRNMAVGHAKHRLLGTVAGLSLRGLFSPEPLFYALHNPFANPGSRLNPSAFDGALQLTWDDSHGTVIGSRREDEVWRALRDAHLTADPCAATI